MRFEDAEFSGPAEVDLEGGFEWVGEGLQSQDFGFEWEDPSDAPARPSTPGAGAGALRVISPTPNISQLVDYLDATVLARGRASIPTANLGILIKQDPPNRPTWFKRLWKDPATLFSNVGVTVELVQVGVSLVPLANYESNFIFRDALNEYLARLHTTTAPCDTDYVPAIGAALRITTQANIEKELGIAGQLGALFRAGKIPQPLSARDQHRLFWIVYATFPDSIKRFVIPAGRIVLDEFAFDKSQLTDSHVAKIGAIARHCAALTKLVGVPPKIVLAGHTDDRGTERYNRGLGERRAAAVNEALRRALDELRPGLAQQTTITAQSFGETRPLVKARSEAEHARNRRVEVQLQKPLRRCTRASLRTTVGRGLKLLSRLAAKDQAQRIGCVLRKLLRPGTDDRSVFPELVSTVENKALALGTYPFSLLRDSLSMRDIGAAASDAGLLASLESIDAGIIAGIRTMNQRIQVLSGAASAGVPMMARYKAVDALRAWMHERVKDDASIYSCYRKV